MVGLVAEVSDQEIHLKKKKEKEMSSMSEEHYYYSIHNFTILFFNKTSED